MIYYIISLKIYNNKMSCCQADNTNLMETKFNFLKEHKIVKIDFKSYWDWNTHNDKCPICRNKII